jgi:protein-disulfide isomerase
MLGILLGDEPGDAGEADQARIGDRVDEAVGEFRINPAILVAPDNQSWSGDHSVLVLVDVRLMHRAREGQQVVRAVLADKRREIAGDESHRHVLGVRHAAFEHALEQRRRAHDTAREAEREACSAALHLSDVLRRQLIESGRVDQHELLHAVRAICGELQGDIAAEVDANDDTAGNAENCHCRVEIFRLGSNSKVGVERTVRLSMTEEIDRVRGVTGGRYRWCNRAPQKVAGSEAVEQQHCGATVTVAVDVHRTGTHRNSQDISLHLDTPLLAFASLSPQQPYRTLPAMPSRSDQPRDRNVPRRNNVREARSASSRPKAFWWLLGVVALVGVAALAYVASKPKAGPRDALQGPDTTNAGPPQGYSMGNPNAPVHIMEFADFECPSCAGYATITEPDVRQRIVNAGLANVTYLDFPLTQHRNTLAASNAAACADEQGKFWPMHDRLFSTQDEWNGEATDVPKPFFRRYAGEIGLDVAKWEACFDARKYQKRISANLADGLRRGVNSTPTFVIGTKLYPGNRSYDQMKMLVDSIAKATGSTGAATSGTAPK